MPSASASLSQSASARVSVSERKSSASVSLADSLVVPVNCLFSEPIRFSECKSSNGRFEPSALIKLESTASASASQPASLQVSQPRSVSPLQWALEPICTRLTIISSVSASESAFASASQSVSVKFEPVRFIECESISFSERSISVWRVNLL